MIVITHLDKLPRCVNAGDHFRLTIVDGTKSEVIIEEYITESKVIDFIASFRYASEDGTCMGFHLAGIFGVEAELPEEIKNAIKFEDLTHIQQVNFSQSVGISLGVLK